MPSTPLDTSRLDLTLRGRTGVFAHRADPRFAYCLYVPTPDRSAPPAGLVVAVHHSLRNFIECRDGFAAFGEARRQVVLAPLFPIGVLGDGNPDGYKYLAEEGIRYDLMLNSMVDEVVQATGCDGRRFCLYGYSGGGHFVHRYLLLHPHRVRAATVGAPGQVTLLDPTTGWWTGIRDVPDQFGQPVDIAALARVPLQLVVGELDIGTDELQHRPGSRYWRAGAEHSGRNRIERLRSLQRSWQAAGVPSRFEVMPGVPHGMGSAPAMALARRFFEQVLEAEPA